MPEEHAPVQGVRSGDRGPSAWAEVLATHASFDGVDAPMFGDPTSAEFSHRTGPANLFLPPRAKSPVQSEARLVPSDHGVWFHDDERVGPPGPDSPQHGPKEPIDGGQSRTWMAARQDRELLPQRQVLERQVTS
jgi:hypothetical protein